MTFRSISLFLVTFCTATWAVTPNVSADIIVDVRNKPISAGGFGTVDVWISSTGSNDIDFASYFFGITAVGSPTTSLQFSDGDFGQFQSTAEEDDADYLFDGLNAGGLDYFVNSPSQLEGFDDIVSGSPLTLTGTERLLARLELEHVPFGSGLGVGDQFRISLLRDNGLPDTDPFFSETEFSFGGLPATITEDSFDNLAFSGVITVTAASAAVPEPATFAVTGLLLLGTWHFRKRHAST